MEDPSVVGNQDKNAEPGQAKEAWKAPQLRELDARHTMLSGGNGADGGSENTSAS